jgi:hypothetical protein
MLGSSPPAPPSPYAPAGADGQTLLRIEQNTTDLLMWVKILVGAVVVLIIVSVI